MNICVVLAHPNPNSFNHALVESYVRGGQTAGHESRVLDLYAMNFETCLLLGDGVEQPLEPDLVKAQEDIKWCNHLVVFFPLWCLTTPARLTGFIERAFAPISAVFENNDWTRLLTGRSCRVVYTADSPIEHIKRDGDPAWLQLEGLFKWGGMDPVKLKVFDLVAQSTLGQRQLWLAEAEEMGLRAE